MVLVLMKRPLASLTGLPCASSCAAKLTAVIMVPSGSGIPFLAASNRLPAGVVFGNGFAAGTVDAHVGHAFCEVLRKGDLVATGAHQFRRSESRHDCNGGSQSCSFGYSHDFLLCSVQHFLYSQHE